MAVSTQAPLGTSFYFRVYILHYSTSGSMYYIILLPGLCITLLYFRVYVLHYSTSGSMYYIILLPGLCITLFYFRVYVLHYSTSGSMYYIILLPGLCITLFYFRVYVLQLFRGGTPLKNIHEQGRGIFADYDLRSAEVLISSCRLAALSCTYH